MVVSTPACPYCKRAKEALTAAGIPYAEVNVGTDSALRQMVRIVSGSRTVPQVGVAAAGWGKRRGLVAWAEGGAVCGRWC